MKIRLRDFRHPAETPLFVLGVLVTLGAYAFVVVLATLPDFWEIAEGVELLLLLVFLPLTLILLRRTSSARNRTTAVVVDGENFPQIAAINAELAEGAGMQPHPLYVVRASDLQTCLVDRAQRDALLIAADAVSGAMDHDPIALRYLVAHELGHRLAGHGKPWRVFAANLLLGTPVLGYFLTRAQEYTADRYAQLVVPEAMSAGYRLMAIGKDQLANITLNGLLQRGYRERGFFVWVANLGETTPPITWRVAASHDARDHGRLMWPPRRPKTEPTPAASEVREAS